MLNGIRSTLLTAAVESKDLVRHVTDRGDFKSLLRDLANNDATTGAAARVTSSSAAGEALGLRSNPLPGHGSRATESTLETPAPELEKDNAPIENSGEAAPSSLPPRGRQVTASVSENTFVPTPDTSAPHLVRFQSVPDHAKFPLGPYRQAPAEFGGDWWQVNPFTGSEPWRKLNAPSRSESLPEGFERVFGPMPQGGDFKSGRDYQVARTEWEQNLRNFQGIGLPEGIDENKLAAAKQAFTEWGLGEPVFFQDQYGWRVRFPDSEVPTYGGSPNTAVEAPHVIIANYQVKLVGSGGGEPERWHPFVPVHIQGSTEPGISS